jgi:hypothetical protein
MNLCNKFITCRTLFRLSRNRYVIPQILMTEGLYCTVFCGNEYHRCIIIDLLPKTPDFIKVSFLTCTHRLCANSFVFILGVIYRLW